MDFNHILYSEIIFLADSICEDEMISDDGIYWETLNRNNKFTQSSQCNIYSGTSGVVLFLLELYEENKEIKYLNRALKGLSWIIKNYSFDDRLTKSFFTGSLGIIYVFHKACKITNNIQFLEDAKTIFEYYLRQEDESNSSIDLINGVAGEIIGLLHIHSFTNDHHVLSLINSKVEKLISLPIFTESGIAWENSFNYQQPLCGFSHGASGIGWVFIELGHYFQNNAFYWLAEQTYSYEDSCYNSEKNNWPDFRANIRQYINNKDYTSFMSEDISYFTTPTFSNAWCHGASGIGLSRLRAYQILKKDKYRQEAVNALNCTVKSDIKNLSPNSFGLCHGDCGNADLFIEASNVLNSDYIDLAKEIALRTINIRAKEGKHLHRIREEVYDKDITLFGGDSGIAYYYLRVFNNGKTPSILLPRICQRNNDIDVSQYEFLNSTAKEFKLFLLKKVYPKTILEINKNFPNILTEYILLQKDSNLGENFYDFLKENYPITNERLYDLFLYEYKLYSLMTKNINYSLWYIKSFVNIKRAEIFKNTNIEYSNFSLSEEITMLSTKWDWSGAVTDMYSKEENCYEACYFIFFLAEFGVREIKISEFNYNILNKIKSHPKIEFHNLLGKIILDFDDNELNNSEIASFLSEQIAEFLKTGILQIDGQ